MTVEGPSEYTKAVRAAAWLGAKSFRCIRRRGWLWWGEECLNIVTIQDAGEGVLIAYCGFHGMIDWEDVYLDRCRSR